MTQLTSPEPPRVALGPLPLPPTPIDDAPVAVRVKALDEAASESASRSIDDAPEEPRGRLAAGSGAEAALPADPLHPRIPISRKVVFTALSLAALLAAPYAHPALASLRAFDAKAPAALAEAAPAPAPIATEGEVALPGETRDTPSGHEEERPRDARGPIAQAAVERAPVETQGAKKPLAHLEDPSGHAMDVFFDKLARVERKQPGAIARVLYYGDSIVASDMVTAKLRRLYQGRFGDAGHGYAILANAWPGWFHLGVERSASADWKVSRLIGPYAADGLYGLGGVSFQVEKADAWSRFATAQSGENGLAVSRFDLEYLAQPGGGDLSLLVDGAESGVLHTAADATALAHHRVSVPDGKHSLEVRTVDDRPVRAFGIRMERDVPGVSLSALGVTGARARFLDKSDDAHWAEALRAATPDLVALAFGSNETTDGTMYPLVEYEATLRIVMKQVRAALPGASLMLVAPPDMATAVEGTGHTRPALPQLVKIQRRLAGEEGWAFFDQYTAMGGAGSMFWWIKLGMGSTDMFHPTESGANQLGAWQFHAMMESYEAFARAPARAAAQEP